MTPQTNIPTTNELWHKYRVEIMTHGFNGFNNAITELSKAYEAREERLWHLFKGAQWMKRHYMNNNLWRIIRMSGLNKMLHKKDQRIADLEAKIAELEGTVGSNEYRPWDVEGITQIAWWKKLHLEDSARIADLEQQVVEKDERLRQLEGISEALTQETLKNADLTEQLTASNERMKQMVGKLRECFTIDAHKPFALHVSDDGLLIRKREVQAIIAEFDV